MQTRFASAVEPPCSSCCGSPVGVNPAMRNRSDSSRNGTLNSAATTRRFSPARTRAAMSVIRGRADGFPLAPLIGGPPRWLRTAAARGIRGLGSGRRRDRWVRCSGTSTADPIGVRRGRGGLATDWSLVHVPLRDPLPGVGETPAVLVLNEPVALQGAHRVAMGQHLPLGVRGLYGSTCRLGEAVPDLLGLQNLAGP